MVYTKSHRGASSKELSSREMKNDALAKKMAAEGIVLLKNDSILPLDDRHPVVLLGSGGRHTVKGGIGSGDVNNRINTSIYTGMKNFGAAFASESWLDDFDVRYNNAREAWKNKVLDDCKLYYNPFDAYAANPFSFPDGRPVDASDLEGASAAIYVISRISGEGKDRKLEKGDYFLSTREAEDISFICKYVPVILIVNAGGAVELTDILDNEPNVRAVLNISQLGQAGGRAVADVLYGAVNPSGKLTATWARKYSDYPYSDEYAAQNGNLKFEEYKDDIYVGYRYFNSFDVKPMFPFGHGLSYTSFGMKLDRFDLHDRVIELDVSVVNKGADYYGKEVVQCYVSLPECELHREKLRLADFKKTELIAPSGVDKVCLSFDEKNLASFFEEKNSWVITKGIYGIWVGSSSENLDLVYELEVAETTVIETVDKVCPLKQDLITMHREAADVISNNASVPRTAFKPVFGKVEYLPKKYEIKPDTEELLTLLCGAISDEDSHLGCAGVLVPGSAGETTHGLEEKYGVPTVIMADGPAGLRLRQTYEVNPVDDTVYGMGVLGALDNGYLEPIQFHDGGEVYYQFCTAFPVGTAVAQSWNSELMYQFGEAIAVEMQEFGVHLWLAPGLNIHRNPLCGRNFEYFSEDPLVSGRSAASITAGVQSKKGCGVTIKHFACNNQEDNRMGVDAVVSERALREIYLRGFEIAIKESQPIAMMTSYNLINGVHTANSKDLCDVVARGEWGFEGLIISDWSTTMGDDGSVPYMCAMAGNDIIMPGNPDDEANIKQAFVDGRLTEEAITACASRIFETINKLGLNS